MRPGQLMLRSEIYHAPSTDEGAFDDSHAIGLLAMSGEVEFGVNDLDTVSEGIEGFMQELYGTDRYAGHNDRILKLYDAHSHSTGALNDDPVSQTVDKMAIILHDFVDHVILNPEKTAAKLGRDADEVKESGLTRFNEMLNTVGDQDGLIKAALFTIDASKWESAARIWRRGATTRVARMIDKRKIDERSGAIVTAAVNKTPLPDGVDNVELEQVLKKNCLVDLKLEAISQGTLNHNTKGLFFKALETLDIIHNPPKDNPASTYRDCTEAINFFVPALTALGYKQLAADLRGTALMWLYNDPEGYAKRQHELSRNHFSEIETTVYGLLDREFSGVEVDAEGRVKTEGSLRQKLASRYYESITMAPDGVGFAFIVPDDMAGEEMEQFARSYQNKLISESGNIVAKHPRIENDPFEVIHAKERKSGYEAIHMTFYYYPPDKAGEAVPLEVQVITKTQHRMKLYGHSSDLFYKSDTSYIPEDQPHLDHLAKRADADREMSPGSTIQSIAEMMAVAPEIPLVFNKLFRVVDTSDGKRILLPKELETSAREVFCKSGKPRAEPTELIVLPAHKVKEGQFLEALRMISRDLAGDKNILRALALVKESEAKNTRDDGVTSVLEGHILPTALAAVVLAVQSGKIWDSNQFGPDEEVSNVATIALLHDYVENSLPSSLDPETKVQKRQEMLYEIKRTFSTTIMEGVDALTLHLEIENEFERREHARKAVQENYYAQLIKPADRWQNHVTDLVKLTRAAGPVSNELYIKFMNYFAKTDRHLSSDFRSPLLPGQYPQVHDVLWRLARHFGYKKATYLNNNPS